MKILLFGSTGQVGKHIKKKLNDICELVTPNSNEVDFLESNKVIKYINKVKPEIIINAAAYTNVTKAESEHNICEKINSSTVKCIANYANENNVLLFHFSSDYVYDGTSTKPHIEQDKLKPISFYGKSKLLSETYIKDSKCFYIILRTSWVYGGKKSFIFKIIDQINNNKKFYVVDDQIGSPTPDILLSEIIYKFIILIKKNTLKINLKEIFNICPEGYISRYELANYIFNKKFSKKNKNFYPVNSSKILDNIRPKNSKMNIIKIKNFLDIDIKDWTIYLDKYLKNIC